MVSMTRKIIFSALSIALGAWTFYTTQQIVMQPEFEPVVAACNNRTLFEQANLPAYEPMMGLGVLGSFVCIITQFLHSLVQSYPAGLLTWGTTMLVATPVLVLILVEAGREGAYGIIRYPMIVGILYQVFGISVIIPLFWVPAYCFGHGNGRVSSTRAKASLPLILPMIILTIFLFTLDMQSYAWTLCAGILGGPTVAMIAPAILWAIDSKASSSTESSAATLQAKKHSSYLVALAYGASGVLAVAGWYTLIYVAWNYYGTNVAGLLSDMWGPTANPAVRFMTTDATVLWIGLLIHIAFRNTGSALEAVLLTPLFGPGAACALALSGVETMEEAKFKND